MAETIYLATTGNDNTAVHDDPDYPYATLATALTSISAHNTTLIIKDGTYTLTSSDGLKDTTKTSENASYPFPNLVHVVRSNVTIQAENTHKAIIDCQNTQGAIWFLTNWSDAKKAGSINVGNGSYAGVGETRSNDITFNGIVIRNFRKVGNGKYNFTNSAGENGGDAGFINYSDGFVGESGIGSYGNRVTLNKCIVSACTIHNGIGVAGTECGIISSRLQNQNVERFTDLAEGVATVPAQTSLYGGASIIYKQCLIADCKMDVNDINGGLGSFFGVKTGTGRTQAAIDSTFHTMPLSANFVNNTFYFTNEGAAQFARFVSQSVDNTNTFDNAFNITNNIFYNVGDRMDISGTDPDANYTRSKGSNPTTVTDTNLPVNIYSNNCFFGFTSAGGFPAYADFPTLSGNLHDTDPQILAPAQNRWGLRQNSPCANNGNKNTVEF